MQLRKARALALVWHGDLSELTNLIMTDHTLWFSASSPLRYRIRFNPYVDVEEVAASSLRALTLTLVQIAVMVDYHSGVETW